MHEEESENLETSQQQVNAEFKFAKRRVVVVNSNANFCALVMENKRRGPKLIRTLYDRLTLATAKKVRKICSNNINRGWDV